MVWTDLEKDRYMIKKTQKTYLIILKQMLQIKRMENIYEVKTTQSDKAIE